VRDARSEPSKTCLPQSEVGPTRTAFNWLHPPIIDPLARLREQELEVELLQVEAEISRLQPTLSLVPAGEAAGRMEGNLSVAPASFHSQLECCPENVEGNGVGPERSATDEAAISPGPGLSVWRLLSAQKKRSFRKRVFYRGIVSSLALASFSCGVALLVFALEDIRLGTMGILFTGLSIALWCAWWLMLRGRRALE